jgi:hypothetical protein
MNFRALVAEKRRYWEPRRWRVLDEHEAVFDILFQRHCGTAAANTFGPWGNTMSQRSFIPISGEGMERQSGNFRGSIM